MSANLYDVGDQVGLEMTFRNALDVVTDPTVVTFRLTPPTGAVLNYTYPTDPQIVKLGTGHYSVEYLAAAPGVYDYGFTGTGPVAQTEEAQFFVREPLVRVTRSKGYTTPKLVGDYLGRTLDGQQAIQCELTIAAVERVIDQKLGRTWSANPITEYHELHGDGLVMLRNPPITLPLTSVSIGFSAAPLELPTVLTSTSYAVFDAARGYISIPGYGEGATAIIVYTGPLVEADVQLAASMIAAAWLGPSFGEAMGNVKSYSVAGEISVTYADGSERAIPADACEILDTIPHVMLL